MMQQIQAWSRYVKPKKWHDMALHAANTRCMEVVHHYRQKRGDSENPINRIGLPRGVIYCQGLSDSKPHRSTPYPPNRQLSSRTATLRPGSRDPSLRAIPPNHPSLRHPVTSSQTRSSRPPNSIKPTAPDTDSREPPSLLSSTRTSSVFNLNDPSETGVNQSIESLAVLALPSYNSKIISDMSSQTEPVLSACSAG